MRRWRIEKFNSVEVLVIVKGYKTIFCAIFYEVYNKNESALTCSIFSYLCPSGNPYQANNAGKYLDYPGDYPE